MSLNAHATSPLEKTGKVIRTIIADDERLAREKLRNLLASETDVKLVAECSNGKQAISAIRLHRADLLLLDIQMPDMDGFEVLNELSAEEMPAVIFTSAYDQYAIRAFEVRALDYLLKPFDHERLHHAIERARRELGKSQDREITHRILDLLSQVKSEIKSGPSPEGRLVIRAKGRVVFLTLGEIDWIEADDKYVHLHTSKARPMVRQTLSAMEAQLDPAKFRRVHRSAIVNVERIAELQPLFSGEYSILLQDGTKLTLSRNYKDKLFELLGKPL